MYIVCLAMTIFLTTCLADDLRYNEAFSKEADENIKILRRAKERAEKEERAKNSLAAISDQMIKDSFDSQLQSKMDILYENHTDFTKELKFLPPVYNCGKEFDIFKLLELAKAHKNITTEAPKCLEDLDETTCQSDNGKSQVNNNVSRVPSMTPKYRGVLKYTAPPASRNLAEVPPGAVPKPPSPTTAQVEAASAPLVQPPADKKGELKPAEKPPKSVKIKPSDSKMAEDDLANAVSQIDERAGQAGADVPQVVEENEVISKAAAAIRNPPNTQLQDNNSPTAEIIQVPEDNRQFDDLAPAPSKTEEQIPQVAIPELNDANGEEQKTQEDNPEASVLDESLQQKLVGTIPPALQAAPAIQTGPAVQAASQAQAFNPTLTVTQVMEYQLQATKTETACAQAPQQQLQIVRLTGRAPEQVAPEQSMQAGNPIMSIMREQRISAVEKSTVVGKGKPQPFKPIAQDQTQVVMSAYQPSVKPQSFIAVKAYSDSQAQPVMAAMPGSEAQPQAVMGAIPGSEAQSQAFMTAKVGSDSQPQSVIAGMPCSEARPQAVMGAMPSSEAQPQAVMSADPSFEQPQAIKQGVQAAEQYQPALKQIFPCQPFQLARTIAAIVPGPTQFAINPTAVAVQAPVQAVLSVDNIHQPVAKQPLVTTLNTPVNGQAPHVEVNKVPVVALVENLAMEPSAHINAPPISKANMALQNVPATAYFWGYDLLPNTGGVLNSGQLQNNVVSDANNPESRYLPETLQNNPKLEYVYYHD